VRSSRSRRRWSTSGLPQLGAAKGAPGNSAQLTVKLKALPPGTYKVIWRVLSVDTHRTQGSFSFSVGP
jgi:methionine-rich copper-binding protein CopC